MRDCLDRSQRTIDNNLYNTFNKYIFNFNLFKTR